MFRKSWIALLAGSVGITSGCSTPGNLFRMNDNPPPATQAAADVPDIQAEMRKAGLMPQEQNGIAGTLQRATAGIKDAISSEDKAEPAKDVLSLTAEHKELDADVHFRAARLFENRGNIPQAIEHYNKALAKEPGNVKILVSFARMHDRQGDFEKAVAAYQQACQTDPNNAMPRNDLGLCYARQKQFDRAEQELAKAIALRPDHQLYRSNMATVLIEAGRTADALSQLKSVHNEAEAHYNLGYLLMQTGREELAVSELRRAIELKPDFSHAQRLLARATQQPASVGTRDPQPGRSPENSVAQAPSTPKETASASTSASAPTLQIPDIRFAAPSAAEARPQTYPHRALSAELPLATDDSAHSEADVEAESGETESEEAELKKAAAPAALESVEESTTGADRARWLLKG